ncbi:MAG: hypothetical protein KIH03_09360 [Paludibacteraceae bacterium]|nr:hypothetical protein [Paludibacteraceae bacterium]
MKCKFCFLVLSPLLLSCNQTDTNVMLRKEVKTESLDSTKLSVKIVPFTSPDRQRLDVRGNVVKLVVHSADYYKSTSSYLEQEWKKESYVFDRNGKASPKERGDKESRNEKGQLVRVENVLPDWGITTCNTYKYNADGFVDSIISKNLGYYETSFEYDSNQNCISSKKKLVSEGTEEVSVVTYQILETDSIGNWTKRSAKMVVNSDCDEDVQETDMLEWREITYQK